MKKTNKKPKYSKKEKDTLTREAIADCISAWDTHKNVLIAWCCHHEQEIEMLGRSPFGRINYILRNKPSEELVCRFNNFRPVTSKLPKELNQIARVYNKVFTKGLALCNEHDKLKIATNMVGNRYWREREKWLVAMKPINKKLQNLEEIWDVLVRKHKKLITKAHKADVPTHTWNGHSIFD